MLRVLTSVLLFVALAAARTPASARATGAVRGRVDLRVERSLRDARPDPGGLGMGSAPRDPQERRRSVVYIDRYPVGAFEQPDHPRRVRMVQQNERFIPHVLAIVAGTYVDFPNADRTYHNVFSLSKDNKFDLGRYAAGKSAAVRFEQPGIVRVFCDIHSQMSAFILVFSHRFFATTDDDDRYRIDGIPPGTYVLALWNETQRGEPQRKTIVIPETGGEIEQDFVLR
jgi:plastocyanin